MSSGRVQKRQQSIFHTRCNAKLRMKKSRLGCAFFSHREPVWCVACALSSHQRSHLVPRDELWARTEKTAVDFPHSLQCQVANEKKSLGVCIFLTSRARMVCCLCIELPPAITPCTQR